MVDIKIRHNGIKPNNIVADFVLGAQERFGGREASLYGCGYHEIAARRQLIEQTKAARDSLNLVIEEMIEELCDLLQEKPLEERQSHERG